jgi:hypothetical protein
VQNVVEETHISQATRSLRSKPTWPHPKARSALF